MANLRLITATATDSTHISASFSEPLFEGLEIDNVLINSQTPGVPDPQVLGITITGNTLTVLTQPMTPQAAYFVIFQSTSTTLFKSLNGDAVILNDGITNQILIIGPTASDNAVLDYFTNFFRNNVYDLTDPTLFAYLNTLSTTLSKALNDIKQSGNENYLSTTIIDENKLRGTGSFDRLNEEGAYEILRVGLTQTGTGVNSTTPITSFPNFPISLLSTNNSEDLTINSIQKPGTIDLGSLTITCSKQFVIILNSITFIYNSILPPYQYNIEKFGYQLNNSKYDPNFAFTFLPLANNQIRLSEKVLTDPNFSLNNIGAIQINYQFQDLGKIINANSLIISTVLSSGREVLPPIENTFTLANAPIVKNDGSPGMVGDVVFINPNVLPNSNTPHPAFLYEVAFRQEYIPSRPGEYAIDYSTGNVYVFGADTNMDGTGPFPPLATYFYQHTFKSEIDYVFDVDSSDLIALPNGNLLNSPANISYNSEEVLVQNIDYKIDAHIEALSERIQNRLIALNVIQPLNFPVTNVFRIFNETSGEVYKILRWTDSKIFFSSQKPPRIIDQVGERASFQDIFNETLFVSSSTSISPNINLFQIFLNNNNIMAGSEDSIGYSENSTIFLANTNIFKQELYFDSGLTVAQNNARLMNIGDYQIDYVNGIIWALVSSSQDNDVGSVSYKRGYIAPNFPHLITVDDLYYRFSSLSPKKKSFSYLNFTDGQVLPKNFDVSNENFLMNNSTLPYQILGGQIGAFINATFTPGVTSDIKLVRNIFEHTDLLNNIDPINFATNSFFSGRVITVPPNTHSEYHSVQFDGTNYYVLVNTPLFYLSPNITFTASIIRLSDSLQLWNGSGTLGFGQQLKLILPGINSPQINDSVLVNYSFTINDLSRIIVDYNKGDYFIDYSYLADEIIISYEYGDNVLDFRQSSTLNQGDQYFVSYRAGALRDALLKNFGSLIDILILNNLNVDFERERYRDALMAAMQSFSQGPTVASLKNIVNIIVHTPPEIIESAFQNWSIGNDLLNLEPISTNGDFSIVPAKYDNGVLINQPNQSIRFPVISNLRLEQGTMEMWVIPNWNGLDNQSDLTFNIIKNGSPISNEQVFIGPAGYHPTITSGSFTINYLNKVSGKPNESKDGVFIYTNPDPSGLFDRWYVDISDGYSDGYGTKNFRINISTNGKVYDVKPNPPPLAGDAHIFSGTNNILYTTDGYSQINEGLTFIADYQHYLFDFGASETNNRFSIFKDESGYLNFRVIDKRRNTYLVDADISSWNAGEQHHIATSWKLNTKNQQDEMHLFIDGFEVPNIIKYNSKLTPFPHEKFRTVDPEEIVGVIPKNIIASTDLVTTFGSNQVSSSINFSANGIAPGDIIFIQEPGFSNLGYTITIVNGQTLTLSTTMPATTTGSSYSVNKTSFNVLTEIDIYDNIAVSLLHEILGGSDLQVALNSNQVTSTSTNFTLHNIIAGYLLRIAEPGFDHHYTITAVSGNTLTLSDPMPSNFTNAVFIVYSNVEQEIPGVRALHPAYALSRDANFNNVLTIQDKALANDIVLIRTLGINHKRISNKYYVWGSSSNILKTKLPNPILLDDVNIIHILLDTLNVGPFNSTLAGGVFTSNNILTDQPSTSTNGRTLSVYISGDNIDYSSNVSVTIHGTIGGVPSSSTTLTFTSNSTQNTTSLVSQVNYVVVSCKPIDPTQNCLVIKIQELYPITTGETSAIVPVIKYSYQILAGNSLQGIIGMNTVSDLNNSFSVEDVGNYLIISSPGSVAGTYQITAVSEDLTTATLNQTLAASFSGGVYQVLNTTATYSGLQNGFFTFEEANLPGTPYPLVQGLYELDYFVHLAVPIGAGIFDGYIGTDLTGNNNVNATIDEFLILSKQLTDVRIGEVSLSTDSITQHFNSLMALQPTSSTLMLAHFDNQPFVNSASVYTTSAQKFIQSSSSINSNFNQSIDFTNTPLLIDNTGILNTQKAATIEFWVSPLFDTYNDPNYRFYFDASGIVTEKVTSLNNATVKVAGTISNILSVKLQIGKQSIDYFAGGTIDADRQTIFLNQQLPSQQTPVTVTYVPNGLNGDRISIYKDPFGYVNFNITATGTDYQIRAPIFWTKNSWHRLRAQYQVNQGLGVDQIRFFIDGYEQGNIRFGNGLLFNQGMVFGSSFVGSHEIQAPITFKDTINEFVIGSDYTQTLGAFALIDNVRISDIFRPLYMPFGESLDPNYSSNLNIVFPVTTDLNTTLLLDFDSLLTKITSFATLKNKITGLFDITVNIFDSFDIVKENPKVKEVLETLIDTLKPANSTVFINYS
jgi:hypothetical protein